MPCALDPLLSVDPLTTGVCAPIQWTTPDGNPPPDRAPPKVEYISTALKGYATFLSVMSWVSWAAILVVLMIYRKTKLLKASQPPMLALILLGNTPSRYHIVGTRFNPTLNIPFRNQGMFYANIRVTLSTAMLPTTSLCNARFWLGHLGFTLVPG